LLYLCASKNDKTMTLIYKPTNEEAKAKRVRKSGKVELENGVVIPLGELELNWKIKKQ
jgi:hypothetical protein